MICLKTNKKITEALKNIYLILDVSAVYAAIFKRYKQYMKRQAKTEAHTTATTRDVSSTAESEKQRDTSMMRERAIEETRTYTPTHAEKRKTKHMHVNVGTEEEERGEIFDHKSSA